MTILPTQLERLETGGLRITWSDSEVTDFTVRQLRDACPCATCREKRNAAKPSEMSSKSMGLPVLSAAEAQPLGIGGMRPVGNYAYNIAFSDGHDSGIFTFDFLRELAN